MKVLALVLIAISMVGCDIKPFGIGKPTEEETLQAFVRANLKDPDSAKFGQFTSRTENAAGVSENAACLTVNARNSLGGYTGDQQALLLKEKGIWRLVSISMETHENCIETMSSRLR